MHVVIHISGQWEKEKGKSEMTGKAFSLRSITCLVQNVRCLCSTFIPENGTAWWYPITKHEELMFF